MQGAPAPLNNLYVMKEKISMTDEQREVMAWLRGGDMTPNETMEDRFIEMVSSLVLQKLGLKTENQLQDERALLRQRRRDRVRESVRSLSIKGIMQDIGAGQQQLPSLRPLEVSTPPAGNSQGASDDGAETMECSGLDSVDLARALVHMGERERLHLNKSLVQAILYIAYGVWMSDRKKRLTVEHPQMWQFGPVFPRAYNRMKKGLGDCRNAYESLKANDRDVFNLLTNCYRRFARNSASVLTAPHMADGSPWACKRQECPDKWGVPMDDRLIGKWFEQMGS